MRKLLKFQSFNESRGTELIKRLEVPVPIVRVTEINPVEHKILMSYFRDYSWSMAFDPEDRLFFGGGDDDGHDHPGRIYVTKEDIHSLMTPDDLKLEQMCLSINDLINDVLIEDMDTLTIKPTLNSYQYKTHDLITITAIPIKRGDRIAESSVDKIKMFVDLLSDTQQIFKIEVRKNESADYSVEEFENMNDLKNIVSIQIHVAIRQRIFSTSK